MITFQEMGLGESLLKAVADEGYAVPTPIQSKAIVPVLSGRDLLACAQTGTGKTAAFALPLIERLHRSKATSPKSRPGSVRVLVLAPTRELANQIHESFRCYGRHNSLKAAVVYGGVSQRPQAAALSRGVDVLTATPGRLLDLISQRLVDLSGVEAFVLDEADRMLDMGFIRDVQQIAARLPKSRQTLLFSATMPTSVRQLAGAMLRDPLEVRVSQESSAAPTIDQEVYHVEKKQKRPLLVRLLNEGSMKRVLVFTRTKHSADRLQRDLCKAGVRAEAIHGNKSQANRERTLREFKSQRPPVLVATDIAARGIDVDLISHVVNFDLPHTPETYVHRIGRTGRAGMTGTAVSFCDAEERILLRAIERLTRQTIPVKRDKHSQGAAEAATTTPSFVEAVSRETQENSRPSGAPAANKSRRGRRRPFRTGGGPGKARRNSGG